jgi:hypothetical protein
MGWSGLNQRQFPRINARLDITIEDGLAGLIHTQTENLGIGGVRVILKQELEKLTTVHLKLCLVNETPGIDCKGRIVWIVRSKEPATGKVTFDTGIEFRDLKPQDAEKIEHFIQNK